MSACELCWNRIIESPTSKKDVGHPAWFRSASFRNCLSLKPLNNYRSCNRSRGSDRSLVGFGNSLSRRDFVIIAQRFNAGKPGLTTAYSPVGTTEYRLVFSRPYGTSFHPRPPLTQRLNAGLFSAVPTGLLAGTDEGFRLAVGLSRGSPHPVNGYQIISALRSYGEPVWGSFG